MTNLIDSGLASRLTPLLTRLSTRERALIVGLLFIGLTLAPIKAHDWSQAALGDVISARTELDLANRTSARAKTSAVEQQLTQQEAQIANWSWSAPSIPVGQVLVEEQLQTLIVNAGLTTAIVKSSDAVQQLGGVTIIPIEITGPFNWPAFARFMASVKGLGKGFYIQSMAVQVDNLPTMKLSLQIPLRLTSNGRQDALLSRQALSRTSRSEDQSPVVSAGFRP